MKILRSPSRVRPLLLILACGLTASPVAAANTSSGHFRLDKVKSSFTASCAYRVSNDEAPGSTQLVVLLANKPLDCAAYDTGFNPIEAAEDAMGKVSAATVVLKLSPAGDSAGGSWQSREPSDSFSFGGQGEFKLSKNTDTRVEGRYRTLKAEPFFDKTFDFDLKFAADVLAGSLAGTALPAGGGDPGKTLQAYLKAVGKKDMAGAKKFALDEYASMAEYAREMELQQATVSGGLVKGTRAALDVAGKTFGGDKVRGRVFLVQEGGAWKVANRSTRMVFD